MDNCSQHKKDLFGETDMKKVAEAIRYMHHQTRAILIDEISRQISLEGLDDQILKPKLANELFMVAGYLSKAADHSKFVWQISKPFMNQPECAGCGRNVNHCVCP